MSINHTEISKWHSAVGPLQAVVKGWATEDQCPVGSEER